MPGDVFIAALGASGRVGHASYVMTMLIVFSATMLGSTILFEISRRLGRPVLRKGSHRFGFDGERAEMSFSRPSASRARPFICQGSGESPAHRRMTA